MPWLAKNPNVDVILTAYNFTMEPFMNSVIEEADKAGKGIVAMKVMAGGLRRIQRDRSELRQADARGRDALGAEVGAATIPTSTPPSPA